MEVGCTCRTERRPVSVSAFGVDHGEEISKSRVGAWYKPITRLNADEMRLLKTRVKASPAQKVKDQKTARKLGQADNMFQLRAKALRRSVGNGIPGISERKQKVGREAARRLGYPLDV